MAAGSCSAITLPRRPGTGLELREFDYFCACGARSLGEQQKSGLLEISLLPLLLLKDGADCVDRVGKGAAGDQCHEYRIQLDTAK